jgi:hypothetical protein
MYDFGGIYQEFVGMRRPLTISGDVMGEVKNFKYLRSFIQNDGDFSMDVSAVR